uniref:TWiK family of potassium channels protein 7 n=1 Tax=Acrobeloides nanus TaxID=290746 RepID=A0A914CFY7_9BILA
MRRETMYVPKEDAFNASSSEDEASFGSDTQHSESEINLGRMPSMDHQGSIEIHTSKMRIFVKYIKIIGPHIGLVALLVSYLLIGATIFHYIEVPNEIKTKEKELRTIFTLRDNFHENIWNLTHSADTVFNRESFNIVGQEYFEKLVELIFDAYRNQFIDQRHLLNKTEGNDMLWTFANSVFFATTVVTTIGK